MSLFRDVRRIEFGGSRRRRRRAASGVTYQAAHRATLSARRRSPALKLAVAAAVAGGIVATAAAAPWSGHSSDAQRLGVTTSQAIGATPEAGAKASLAASVKDTAVVKPAAAAATAGKSQYSPNSTSAKSAAPYQIYDSVQPSAIPSGQSIATYSDGPYAQSGSAVSGHGNVLWIDVNGSNPSAGALDVEPGDATAAQSAAWVQAKLSSHPNEIARIYTFRAGWPAVQTAVATLPSWMQHRVHYWIADPTGVPHVLAGAYATQWSWGTNYDISSAYPGF